MEFSIDDWFELDAAYADTRVLEHIREVALKGRSRIRWKDIRDLLPARIEYCVSTLQNHLYKSSGERVFLVENTEGRVLLNEVFDKVRSVDDMPFTWRRFCELLYDPLRNYSHPLKYTRALHKIINVVSTIKECQNRRRKHSEPILASTSIAVFFAEENLDINERKRRREDVQHADKVFKYYLDPNRKKNEAHDEFVCERYANDKENQAAEEYVCKRNGKDEENLHPRQTALDHKISPGASNSLVP